MLFKKHHHDDEWSVQIRKRNYTVVVIYKNGVNRDTFQPFNYYLNGLRRLLLLFFFLMLSMDTRSHIFNRSAFSIQIVRKIMSLMISLLITVCYVIPCTYVNIPAIDTFFRKTTGMVSLIELYVNNNFCF